MRRNGDECEYGIVCLTPHNLESPWILFESGALSKRVAHARVSPYLFGLKVADVTGPLSQFHMRDPIPWHAFLLSITSKRRRRNS